MPHPIECDAKRHEVRIRGRRAAAGLSVQEFALLDALCSRNGDVCGRDELGAAIWGAGNFEYNMLHRLVHRTKRKLAPFAPDSIVAIAGVGYKIEIAEAPAHEGPLELAPAPFDDRRFVGRLEELAELTSALDSAFGGSSELVMLAGEPGIGKTRLAEELCTRARDRGAQTLSGRCYEGEASMPYAPFVEALRQYTRPATDAALRAALGREASEIAMLLPELRTRFEDIADPPPMNGDGERLHLFESVTQFFIRIAAAAPLVLVLDDLHWADKPTLLLLQYAVHNAGDAPIMLVGAYRDVEVDRVHPLAEALDALRREPQFRRVRLTGLSADQLACFLPSNQAAGLGGLAAALSIGTEGNPFFAREVIRHLIDVGTLRSDGNEWVCDLDGSSDLGIPEGVRDVIGRRLSRLSDDCNRMLTTASAATGGIAWDVLRSVVGDEDDGLLDILDEALDARILQEAGEGRDARFEFTHSLIRQTLYSELSAPRRSALHLRIGEVLESIHTGTREAHVRSLAEHFYAAGAAGAPDKTIRYLSDAGCHALDAYAYEDAVTQFERALEFLSYSNGDVQRRRCEIVVRLASAEANFDPLRSMTHAREASELATMLDESTLLAEAALAYADAAAVASYFQDLRDGIRARAYETVGLLSSAQNALPMGDTGLRVRVLARLGLALPEDRREEGVDLINEALAVASRIDDPEAMWQALTSQFYALEGPDALDERLRITDRLAEVAREVGWDATWLHVLRGQTFMALGDVKRADAELAAFERVAKLPDKGTRAWIVAWKATRTLSRGELSASERLALETISVAQSAVRAQGDHIQSVLPLYFVRREQGRLEEVEPAVRALASAQTDLGPLFGVGLAFLFTELGKTTDARDELRRFSEHYPDLEPRNSEAWLPIAALLTETVWAIGDAAFAARLYDMLRPYEKLSIGLRVTFYAGPVARTLGMLAESLHRWEEADRYFSSSLQSCHRGNTPLWTAYTQFHWAHMLIAQNEARDQTRAAGLLDEAMATADELGLVALRRKIDQARESLS